MHWHSFQTEPSADLYACGGAYILGLVTRCRGQRDRERPLHGRSVPYDAELTEYFAEAAALEDLRD